MSYVNCVSIVNIYIHFIDMGVKERKREGKWCGAVAVLFIIICNISTTKAIIKTTSMEGGEKKEKLN